MARNSNKARKASKSSARRAKPVQHRAGSRKGRVHATYKAKGKDAAIAQAIRLKIKKASAQRWVYSWA